MAAGSIAVAATLALGVAGAAAAPNPGYGTKGFTLGTTGLTNLAPTMNAPQEQAEDGPQTANVPTLAWVGEDVRLVACDDAIKPNPIDLPSIDFQQANWSSGTGGDLWTGDQAAAPAFDGSSTNNLYTDNTSSAFFFPPTGVDETRNGCVSADISSVHAGLDEVTLSVTDEGYTGGPPVVLNGKANGVILDPEVVYQEQFIVIWMTANPPKITEASDSTIEYPTTAGGVASTASQITPVVGAKNLADFLGDGSTPGTFASLDQWGQESGNAFCRSFPGPGDDPFFPCANLTPDTNNGLVQIRVTGSFPIEDQPPATTNEQYFQGITGGGNPSSITLPTQWVALANLMAESSTSYQGTNGSLWDIHGSPTNVLAVMGHAGNGPISAATTVAGLCQYDGTLFNQTTDVVDDCLSTGTTTPTGDPYAFSRVFGDVTSVGNTIGPYDAEAPNATLLSDGNLNTDDAPMPALPVTVSIAKGGLGGLYGISKWLVYSHDFDGAGTDPNGNPIGSPLVAPTDKTALTSTGTANLYNPYYQEYIPSTERPISEASGVTGVYDGGNAASSGDDFPGFSDGYTDPYTFWTALKGSTTDSTPVSNGCLEFDSNVETNTDEAYEFAKQNPVNKGGIVEGTTTGPKNNLHPTGVYPNGLFYYATPDDPTSILVYTDERGEAYVDYNPGIGWYNSIGPDGNGACDLQGLYGKAIGTSSISASVQYPYEEVPYNTSSLVSNTLVKTVDSEWSKTLTAYPKSNLSPNEISVVVAHAQNVNGEPFSGEEVCVGVPANDSVWWDDENPLTVTTPAIDTTGSWGDAGNTSNNTCGYTGTAGNVAFDVSGSDGQTNVDVQAVYVAEHITRDVNIPVLGQQDPVSSLPATVLPGDGTDVVNTNIASGVAGSTGSNSTGSAPVTPVTAVTPSIQAKTANVCKVESVRLSSKLGKFSVSFKLSCSTAKSESVTIRAYRANGKVLRTYKETVKTGKTVKIAIGRKVARVTVIA